jgi:hypothetical protein
MISATIYNLMRRPFVRRETLHAEAQLQPYGIKNHQPVVELIMILMILGVVSLVIWIVVDEFKLQPVPWSQAFGAVLSLGIAIIAYRQWRAARYEISIDKYYDRLESANKRLELLQTNKPSVEDMHAFAELDKLEYVIVKYEYGYISAGLMLRALKNFEGLCKDRPEFSQKAAHWVDRASYREVTRKLVRMICETCSLPSDSPPRKSIPRPWFY